MSNPPQSVSPNRFATLSRPEQLERLRFLSARQKVNLLLDLADGDELLAELPPQDLYLICKELGPDQLPELLGMASAEQWTLLFDFDCWQGDLFDPAKARIWLAVLLDGEEDEVVATLQQMNFELLVLMVQREVVVLSGPEEIEEEDVRIAAMNRDGGYQLEFRDESGAKLFGTLLDLLFRYDADMFRTLLEAARAEGESLLEETVYHERNSRLLDQGIPDPHAALDVYAWLDPESFSAAGRARAPLGGEGTAVSGQLLQLARSGGLSGRILAQGVDGGTAWELACLLNKVLMADHVEAGNLEEARTAAQGALGLLDLALEYLAGDDLEQAGKVLQDNYAEQLFRLGFSLTLRLQQRAGAIRKTPVGPYLDPPFRTLLEALLLRRPHIPESLVRPGRGGQRPFAALREVRLAQEWLERCEVMARLFDEHFPFPLPEPEAWELEGCQPGQGNELTLSALFLTALANQLLGRAFAPLPLGVGELAELQQMISRNGRLDPVLRERTVAWLESLTPGGGAFGEFALARWDEEFCAVAPADLDPRYLGGLIVRLDR